MRTCKRPVRAELRLRPTRLTTADRVITARYLISMLAEQGRDDGDLHAETVRPTRTGTGPASAHVSLRTGSKLAISRPTTTSRGPRSCPPLGLPVFHRRHPGARQRTAGGTRAPRFNSLQADRREPPPVSGASMGHRNSPTLRRLTDRTHYVRVPDDQRVELAWAADGSANPYPGDPPPHWPAGLDGHRAAARPGHPERATNGRGPAPPLPRTLAARRPRPWKPTRR